MIFLSVVFGRCYTCSGSGTVCLCIHAKSLQLCPTLCDPMDCGPPGSSVHGIFQARILEWVVMPSSRGIFPTQGWNLPLLCLLYWHASSLPLGPTKKPFCLWLASKFSLILRIGGNGLWSDQCSFLIYILTFMGLDKHHNHRLTDVQNTTTVQTVGSVGSCPGPGPYRVLSITNL